jgi:hypothetical protein
MRRAVIRAALTSIRSPWSADMTIKFLKPYTVGTPPESFTAGQVVKNRDAASEGHFVRRGVAGYLAADGTLTDYDGRVIDQPKAKARPASPPKAKAKSKPKTKAATVPPAAAAAPPADTRAPPSVALGLADLRMPNTSKS